MLMFDYTCPSCGNTETDVIVKTKDDKIICIMCDSEMDRDIPATSIKTPSRTERKLPDNYKFSRGVNFGKISDG